MKIFWETLIDPIFDVESIGDGPRVPRAHLEVVLTQLLAARVLPLYSHKALRGLKLRLVLLAVGDSC